MHDRTITVFNHHGGVWYPHVIRNADLIATESKGHTAMFDQTNADSVEIIVRFRKARGRVVDSEGNAIVDRFKNVLVWGAPFTAIETDAGAKRYLRPKEYGACADPADCITFTPETDFILDGEWPDAAPIPDSDYENGLYDYMNAERDGVYMLTHATQYRLLPHFEIGGR